MEPKELQLEISQISQDRWRDYKELRLAALKGCPDSYTSLYEEEVAKSDEYWQNKFKRFTDEEEGVMLFAINKETDALIGMVNAWWDDITKLRHIAQVGAVYVSGEYRKRGIGKKLLAAMESELKNHGIEKVQLTVTAIIVPARKLYASMNYREVGTLEKEQKLPNGEYLDSVLMEKILT